MLSVTWLFVQTWPTSFMPNQCCCVMYKFWMPSECTMRDVAFGYFLECDLKRKIESLRIIYYKQKEKPLLLSHIKLVLLHCWFWIQCLLSVFPSPYLHFQKSIVRLITTQVSQKPHSCTISLQFPVGNILIWSLKLHRKAETVAKWQESRIGGHLGSFS